MGFKLSSSRDQQPGCVLTLEVPKLSFLGLEFLQLPISWEALEQGFVTEAIIENLLVAARFTGLTGVDCWSKAGRCPHDLPAGAFRALALPKVIFISLGFCRHQGRAVS